MIAVCGCNMDVLSCDLVERVSSISDVEGFAFSCVVPVTEQNIVKGHAFSILDVREVRIVCMRKVFPHAGRNPVPFGSCVSNHSSSSPPD